MFKTSNIARIATGVFGALLFSTVCLGGALAPAQIEVATHAIA